MRRQRKREPLLQRARRVYSKGGLLQLLVKGYQEFAPYPLWFRYGAVRTLSDPKILFGHFKQHVFNRLNIIYHQYVYDQIGENFMEQDWDNLILLDACRYDVFEEVASLEGLPDDIVSLGGTSPAFMKRNFSGREYHDTVYVTANSFAADYDDGVFHELIDLWDDGWDDDLQAVPPEIVTDAAIKAHETYPDKRLLVHYMQPHAPWIGEKGKRFIVDNRLRDENSRDPDEDTIDTYSAIWHNVIEYDDEELLELYKENLEIVLESVEKLLSEIEDKTVLSADHGELLGEKAHPIPIKTYGHSDLHMDELRHVPWFTIENGTRREVTAEKPVQTDLVDHETVDDRLRALGYRV